MDFKKAQEILLRNEKYARAFDEMSLSFDIARTVIQARVQRNMTQKELAELVETGQSSIARLESGESLPSLSFLKKIAKALHMVLLPPLFIPEEEVKYLATSEAGTVRLKVQILEVRKALASNPGKALNTSTDSATTKMEIFGGGA